MAVPSPTTPSLGKAELRADGLARRRAFARSLTPEHRGDLERALARLVLPHLVAAQTVAFYHPLHDEISPLPILHGLAEGQRAVFPWFARRDEAMIWREGPATEPSDWGVLQPPAAAEALSPDVVIVPIVLADRAGIRIGHGQGHYDRALAHLRESRPVLAIGIAWENQLVDGPLPADPWDMRLDAIATPGEYITCG